MPQKSRTTTLSVSETIKPSHELCYVSERIPETYKNPIQYNVCLDLPKNYEYKGNKYCILHYPGIDKALKFKNEFDEELDKRLLNEKYDLRGVFFPSRLDLSKHEFSKPLNLSWAIFLEELVLIKSSFLHFTLFDNVKFEQTAHFSDSKFECPAYFNSSIFNDSVYFIDTEFVNIADFSSTTFESKTGFDRAVFSEKTDFSSAVFKEGCSFNSAIFIKEFDFSSVKSTGDIQFIKSTFNDALYFTSTVFEKEAIFREAVFAEGSDVLFLNTQFENLISFYYASIKGYISFKNEDESENYFGQNASLDFQESRIESAEKISFYSIRLQPSWFVKTDGNKFVFVDCDWRYFDGKKINVNTEIKKLIADFPNPNPVLTKACWQLADNHEESKSFPKASMFRQMAQESKRLEELNGWKVWSLHWWYWLSSFYGESWHRALLVLAILVFILFPVIYTQTDFQTCSKDRPLVASLNICESEEVRKNCTCSKEQIIFTDAIVQSLTTATLQNVEYRKPLKVWGELWIILEKIFAPLQAALLALAIRRKFMR